jgi:hypothetical protein
MVYECMVLTSGVARPVLSKSLEEGREALER